MSNKLMIETDRLIITEFHLSLLLLIKVIDSNYVRHAITQLIK